MDPKDNAITRYWPYYVGQMIQEHLQILEPIALILGCVLARIGTLALFYRYVFVSSFVVHSIVAHSLSQHLLWNSNGTFDYVVKELNAITFFFMATNSFKLAACVPDFAIFDRHLLLLYVFCVLFIIFFACFNIVFVRLYVF